MMLNKNFLEVFSQKNVFYRREDSMLVIVLEIDQSIFLKSNLRWKRLKLLFSRVKFSSTGCRKKTFWGKKIYAKKMLWKDMFTSFCKMEFFIATTRRYLHKRVVRKRNGIFFVEYVTFLCLNFNWKQLLWNTVTIFY
jgi:hypothetical protein